MDKISQELIIRRLAEKITSSYVLPEAAGEICACLQGHLQAGDYEDCADGEIFALALTLHLQEVNHDEHLWVRWHPEALPDDAGPLRLNPLWQEEQRQKAAQDHYGFHLAERLAGNIGCLDIHHFYRLEWAMEAVQTAMQAVNGTHALIIDLRHCTGGYPETVAYFTGWLFGKQPHLVDRIYWRDENRTREYWTDPQVPGSQFTNQPVTVLTSRATFSAGELCAHFLQSKKRATIIGEKTDGGGHPGVSYRLHPHVEAFIPVGRSIDPSTGADREGTGVLPDIPIPQAHALKAAHFLALRKILESESALHSCAESSCLAEVQAALRNLTQEEAFCSRCGYQNPTYYLNCKNCGEVLVGKR